MALTNNYAGNDGGALSERGGAYGGYDTDINYSTFSGNNAYDDGGAIYGYFSIGEIRNSTFSGNGTGDAGGGMYIYNDSYLYDTTVSGNNAAFGGGIAATGTSDGYLLNTIVSDNSAGNGTDFGGNATAVGSLFENTTGLNLTSGGFGSANITGQDPQLGPLQNNGGPTLTRRPAATSPVLDKGYSGSSIDQRYSPRPVDLSTVANAGGGNAADMGAVELTTAEGPPPVSGTPAPPGPTFNLKKAIKKCKKKFPGKKNAKRRKKCIKKAKRRAGIAREAGRRDWPGDVWHSSPSFKLGR
jgi:predicted outer membrane repeat protein